MKCLLCKTSMGRGLCLREGSLETKQWLCPISLRLAPFTPLELKKSPYLLTSGLRIFFFLLSCRCDKLIKQGLSIFHLFNCLEPRVFSMLGCKFTKSSSATKWQVNSFGRAVFAGKQVQQRNTSSARLHARAKFPKKKKKKATSYGLTTELLDQWTI